MFSKKQQVLEAIQNPKKTDPFWPEYFNEPLKSRRQKIRDDLENNNEFPGGKSHEMATFFDVKPPGRRVLKPGLPQPSQDFKKSKFSNSSASSSSSPQKLLKNKNQKSRFEPDLQVVSESANSANDNNNNNNSFENERFWVVGLNLEKNERVPNIQSYKNLNSKNYFQQNINILILKTFFSRFYEERFEREQGRLARQVFVK